jgi:hypothetical protein
VALQNLVVERLQQIAESEINKMTPVAMARVLDRATIIERRSRGKATSIIKHQGDGESAGVALDLSKLSDAELEIFQELVAKCQPTPSGEPT